MAIAILLGVALLVPRFLTPVVEAVGERIMENATGDLYDVNITALTVTVAGRVKAERISVRKRDDPERTDDAGEATDETGNTLGIIVHGLSIRYNVNRALEENPLSDCITYLRKGWKLHCRYRTLRRKTLRRERPYRAPDNFLQRRRRIKRIEMRLITALGLCRMTRRFHCPWMSKAPDCLRMWRDSIFPLPPNGSMSPPTSLHIR